MMMLGMVVVIIIIGAGGAGFSPGQRRRVRRRWCVPAWVEGGGGEVAEGEGCEVEDLGC